MIRSLPLTVLKLAKASAERVAPLPNACATLNLMKGRVLIIDNDPEYSERLRDELRVLGYEVLAASNSKSGVEVAQTFSPSVIITDSFSVGPDSLSALKELRTNQPQTPVIIAGDQS